VTADGGSPTFPHDLGRKGKVLSAMLEGILWLQCERKVEQQEARMARLTA
jgi:hypothetical protein